MEGTPAKLSTTNILTDIDAAVAEVKEHHAEFLRFGRRTVREAWKLGTALTRLREVCPHGTWLFRLAETGVSQPTANRWMNLAKVYTDADKLVENFDTIKGYSNGFGSTPM